jgi:hypothetical protein
MMLEDVPKDSACSIVVGFALVTSMNIVLARHTRIMTAAPSHSWTAAMAATMNKTWLWRFSMGFDLVRPLFRSRSVSRKLFYEEGARVIASFSARFEVE